MTTTSRATSQLLFGGLCLAGSLSIVQPTQAAEYGWGEYLLGLTLPMAGYVPGPGVYFSESTWFYKGSADGNLGLPLGRNIGLGVHEQFAVNIATLSWITETKILGGSLGFALTAPFGKADVSVDASFTGPLGVNRQAGISQTATGTMDSALTALLGWTEGNNHWSLSATGIIPTGNYDPDKVAFLGLYRPGVDLKAAYTYLDPKVGTEFSGAVGVTLNGINAITDYQTGTELHVEAAVIQHFKLESKTVEEFQVGVGGYVYQQMTGDGGSGDSVGPFIGRTVALGPIVGYTFKVGETPVTLNARWFHEFDVANRVQGDSGFLTMSLPLQVYAAEAAAAKKCPVLTPMMSFVQDQLGRDFGTKIVFVSITVDPERDTPEVLKEYAQAFGANLAGWAFLTGPAAAIRDVARRYGVFAAKNANGNVDHTFLTSIVDPRGILRVQYVGVRFDVEEFRRDLLSLIRKQ